MTKETFASIIRAALQVVASYFLGKHIFGQTVTDNMAMSIIEAVTILGTTIWGFADHTAGVEQIQSGLHSFLTTTLALLSSWGIMSAQNAVAIMALAGTLVPVILSYSGRVKVKQIASGQLNVNSDTGKVTPSIPVAK